MPRQRAAAAAFQAAGRLGPPGPGRRKIGGMARQPSAREIRSLPFRHGAKPSVGIEVFRLSSLLDRADRKTLEHPLDAPQRPEFHTVYLGLRGAGTHVVDFTPVPLGAGYLTFVARGRVQQFVIDRGVDAWMLLFAPELLGGRAGDPLRAPGVLSPVWPVPALAMPAAEIRELLVLVEQLVAEQARPFDALQEPVLAALLRVFLLRAERMRAGGQEAVPAALERFFTILERDHAETRSVAHYARAAGVSPRRLGELLVAQTGKSTKQVIDERAVLELKRLLVHSELSVKELAARTGFAEPTNLVKFFRHHTGSTPLAFRAAHRMFLPSARRS
ncbi:MAG TPA: helix-turn-helix domain-containing protein [Kofleriaceae bacterium]|nr:helix-turn-helix domain-containing protein [Kofleriaceae bacterium]